MRWVLDGSQQRLAKNMVFWRIQLVLMNLFWCWENRLSVLGEGICPGRIKIVLGEERCGREVHTSQNGRGGRVSGSHVCGEWITTRRRRGLAVLRAHEEEMKARGHVFIRVWPFALERAHFLISLELWVNNYDNFTCYQSSLNLKDYVVQLFSFSIRWATAKSCAGHIKILILNIEWEL